MYNGRNIERLNFKTKILGHQLQCTLHQYGPTFCAVAILKSFQIYHSLLNYSCHAKPCFFFFLKKPWAVHFQFPDAMGMGSHLSRWLDICNALQLFITINVKELFERALQL
jgi:hypothetical protein